MLTVPTARYAAWALASTGLDLAAFYCLLCAFHEVDFKVALAAFPWIVTAGGLPVSVAGLGAREGAAVVSLAAFGVAPAVATDAGLLLFAFTGLLPALLGGAWLLVHQARQRWLGAPESRPSRSEAASPHGLRKALEAYPPLDL